MTDATVPQTHNRSTRKVIFWLFGIPIVVFGLSTLLYFLANSKIIDLGTVNNGTLIQPPLLLADLPLTKADGESLLFSELEHKWSFLVIGDGHCMNDCERMLYTARQTIISLGKKMHRAQLVYLSRGDMIDADLHQRFEREYHGIEVAIADAAILDTRLRQAGLSVDLPRAFYIVDPANWLILKYDAADTSQETLSILSKAVLKDMKRLIK